MPSKHKKIIPKSETSSESESESDNSELELAPEYQYDTENFVDPDIKNCVICGKKQSNMYNLIACSKCFKDLSINKTESKKIYGLTDDELEELECFKYRRQYGIVMHLYFLKDVRMIAIQKKFNIVNPDLPTYINCIGAIHTENNEKQEQKIKQQEHREQLRLDRTKAIDDLLKERGIKIDPYNEEYVKYIKNSKRSLTNTVDRIEAEYKHQKKCDARRKKLSKKMNRYGIDITQFDDSCIDTYVDLHEMSLIECVNELKETHRGYIKRYEKLKAALDEHNLIIRSDSYYCNSYLEHDEFTLKEVVDQMVTMDFYINKTTYEQILRNIYKHKRNNRGWRRDDYHELITEDDKEDAKTTALKKYLKKHSKKSVPEIVLNKYCTKPKILDI